MLIMSLLSVHAQTSSIIDFGAFPDGTTMNTNPIQSAIDAAHKQGGGKVVVPQGNFLTGTLVMKSDVELYLEKGATLLGSTDADDYTEDQGPYGLIVADGQENITISGSGTIDGQGQELALAIDSLHHSGSKVDPNYNYRRQRPGKRPRLVYFNDCRNVQFLGVQAKDAASWVLHFKGCEQLVIDRVRVDSDAYWNNDGMDIEDCKNVRITHCYVNSADDGICLKSSDPDSFCDQVYIANNLIRSSASAIKFGTASAGGFKNITIENITIFDTFRSALAFEAVDGGTIENVTASNITATNTGNAIFIKLGHRNPDDRISTIRNITISNLVVDIPYGAPDLDYAIRGPELPFFHNTFPASVTGLPGHYVENVTMENISISYPGKANPGYAHIPLWRLGSVPENEGAYPEFHMFGELPSWAFFVRHVDGLTLKDVRLYIRDYDFRPAYVFVDAKDVAMEGGAITTGTGIPQVVIQDVHGLDVSNVYVERNLLRSVSAYGKNSGIEGVVPVQQPGVE
jgi:hypothetical protein